MKKAVIFIFIGLSCIYAGAQTLVSGKVTDQNGKPMSGVTVYIPYLNKGTVSNNEGKYIIKNLPVGKIVIQFSFIGYNTKIETITLKSGQSNLDISMTEAIVESQEVVVTGGTISSQHQNAVKIDILRSRDIFLSGTSNFVQSLSKIPGVEMIAKGEGVSKPVIRGLSMNDILVLNNGVRIENYQFSENHPMGIDDNDVDQVEVIKGPASLLYGSDALGGVINFIKGKPAPVGTISGDFSSQLFSNTNGFNTSLGIKGALKNVYAGVRVSMKSHEDFKQGNGAFVPNSRFKEWSLSANSGFTGKKFTSRFTYDFFAQKLGMTVPSVITQISEAGRKNEIWYQDLSHHCLSNQTKVFFGRFKWETTIGMQQAQRKLFKTLDIPSVEMKLGTITYESKLIFQPNDKSHYVTGIQGLSQSNRNQSNRSDQFLPDANVLNLGLIAFAQHSFRQKLNLQGGIRYDYYRTETFALGTVGTEGYHIPVFKAFSSVNGSMGATYQYSDKLLFRANIAKAFRVPNLSELTSNGEHGSRYEIGNELLNPEHAYECDISTHYHGKFLSFDLAGFYNHIDDYIYITPTNETASSGLNIFRFSQTNARLYGGEAVIHFHPIKTPWLHCKAIFSSVTGRRADGDYLPFIPARKIYYEIRAGKDSILFFKQSYIWISGQSALEQNFPSLFETGTQSYTLINAGMSTDINIGNQKLLLGLSVNNIFDIAYFDHLSTLKPLGFYNQGRNISLAVKIPFQIKHTNQPSSQTE